MGLRWVAMGWACAFAWGCGGPTVSGTGTDSEGEDSTTGPSTDSTPMTASASMTGMMSDTGTGSGSADDGSSTTASSTSTAGTDDTSTGDDDDGSDSSSTGEPACTATPQQFSNLWVSNAAEGTISKIDTGTMVELGRFNTRGDSLGNPSRTSVNFAGDVAVANRSGGVTAFAGDPERCPDPMSTSTGAGDILPFGTDGCMLWSTDFDYTSQRPVAWTQGSWNEDTCAWQDMMVWTAGTDDVTIDVLLLDGETGMVVETVDIPGVVPSYYGLYGGAVDAEGNFWASQLGMGSLVRVRLDDLSVTTWDMPSSGYGMTVDHTGMVWTCSNDAARFDPGTETWDVFSVGGVGGCNEDGDGVLWIGAAPLVGVQTSTGNIVQMIDLPQHVHGVAVDFDGMIWGVTLGADAYRIDPVTGAFDTFTGLVGAYTYSDMSGFALQNVTP